MPGGVVTCVDTSTFVHLAREYPASIFPSLWDQLAGLVKDERLIAPHQVFQEIVVKSDALARWAKRHRKAFRAPDAELFAIVSEILARFRGLVDPGREGEDADPFVVALSVGWNRRKPQSWFAPSGPCVVVTQESRKPGRQGIPAACTAFGVEAIRHLEFFEKEGWRF